MHGGQVVGGYAGDGQRPQLRQGRSRSASCGVKHRVDSGYHRLQFGRGVGCRGSQCGHGVVDGGQVASIDIADTRVDVHAGRGGSTISAVRERGQRGLGSRCFGGGCGGQTLQFSQSVHATAVVRRGSNGVLHGGQVVVGDTRDSQCLQLGQAGGRAASCGV